MPLHGLKSGLAIRGMHSGRATGSALANIESGYRAGLHNSLPNKEKMLNPINLTGDKKPLVYGLADFFNITGGNTTNLNDIANTGNYWVSNGSVVSRPIPYANTLNGKTILKYDGSSSVMEIANPLSVARNAYTIMCMIKLNGTPSLSVIDSNQITAGAIYVATPTSGASANQIRSRFYSATSTGTIYTSDVGPTNSSSIANTPVEFNDYMLLTCKFRLSQPSGPSSEQDMYINGRKHQILFGADNFSIAGSGTFTIPTLGIGNNPSTQNSLALGFEMGMGLVLPYWLDNAEQEKIENYFRWYYNKSF
jgi:hypothetical protein